MEVLAHSSYDLPKVTDVVRVHFRCRSFGSKSGDIQAQMNGNRRGGNCGKIRRRVVAP